MRNDEPVPTLIWADLETTAISPEEGDILEVAAVATDTDLVRIAAPAERFESIVHWNGDPASLDAFVREMHTANGLLRAASDGSILDEVDRQFARWLTDIAERAGAERLTLAGASVAFDMGWITHHMPATASLLHYRVFDISTLKQALLWGWFGAIQIPDGESPHRAMPDVEHALATARRFRSVASTAPF